MAQFFPGRVFDPSGAEALKASASRMAFRAPVNAPKSFDPRSWLKIENQGSMGSCVGHAESTVGELVHWIKSGGKIRQFSRMFCYLTAQKRSGFFGRDQGAAVSGAVKAAETDGFCQEETFKYTGYYTTKIPQAAITEANQHKMMTHALIRSYSDAYAYLASGIGGIIIGINWTSGLANNRSGLITLSNSRGGTLGGHSLALGGYVEEEDSKGRKKIILINSHDTSWGNKGSAEVDPDVIDAWTNEGQAEFYGQSDLELYDQQTSRLVDFGDVL